MNRELKEQLIAYLSSYSTPHKVDKMQRVALNRTRYVTIALEGIYQPHNISAALRSAECFGLQGVSIIEQRNRYVINKGITKGASDWLTLNRYATAGVNTTEQCFNQLRADNYWIVATSPHAQGYVLSGLPLDRKIALIFGNEETGLSDYALQHADAYVRIPLYGFTESFNISVSVALCLYDVTTRLRQSAISWQLSDDELLDVKLEWLMHSIRASQELIQLFLRSHEL